MGNSLLFQHERQVIPDSEKAKLFSLSNPHFYGRYMGLQTQSVDITLKEFPPGSNS